MSPSEEPRWPRGAAITWTYRNPDFPRLVDVRPVTVVADDDEQLVVWLAQEYSRCSSLKTIYSVWFFETGTGARDLY